MITIETLREYGADTDEAADYAALLKTMDEQLEKLKSLA